MVDNGDWQKDPLRVIVDSSPKFLKLKNSKDNQNDRWRSFHFATRLKLDGADYFCRQALGAASRPDDLGLPLLAHRLIRWYLDAFFFELMAAYDTLLQELNTVYAYDLQLKPDAVRWNTTKKNKFMKKLPENIVEYINEERKKDWFCKVQWYRNTATHHYTVPLRTDTTFVGDMLNYSKHRVSMHYFDDSGKSKYEPIKRCKEYLMEMATFVRETWSKMITEFE